VTAVPALGGTISVGIDQAPTGCNPNTASGNTYADRLVLSLVLPGATAVYGTGASGYDSALIVQAELQSTSPETVVYTINPKAVWSDGVPITAADFIYAWQHQSAVPVVGTGGDADVASTAGYDDIGSMTPSDKGRTLTVVFSTRYADWQGLFHNLLPAHVLGEVGWSPGCTSVDPRIDLSGGPFEISSVSQHQIVLVRNPKWWGQQPNLARIVIKVATGPRQLAQWLFRGVIDVSDPSSFDAAYLQSVGSMPSVKSAVDISNTFLELEFATAAGPTASPLVRDAIAYGIDRSSLDARAVAWADVSIAPSSSHLYVQGQPGYPTTPALVPVNVTTTSTTTTTPVTGPITARTFPIVSDVALQQRDLAESGYIRDPTGAWVDLDGRPLALRLAFAQGDGWATQTAQLLADQLKAEGLSVSTIPEPTVTATGQALLDGTADVAVVPLLTSPYTSRTSAWYTPLLESPGDTGAQDWSGYDSVKVENLFTQATAELDPVTAQPLYDQIDQQLWADMVALPLFAEPGALAWSTHVSGMSAGPFDEGLFASALNWTRLVNEPATYHGTPRLPPS